MCSTFPTEFFVAGNGQDALATWRGRLARCLNLQAMPIVAGALWLLVITTSAASPLIIAHRGASHDAPENTLTAFNLAWQQGADGIEVDLQLTKDGHVVCIHDADTRKVANRRLVVRDSTLEELQSIDVGAHHGDAFHGERIPTLDQVLATVPPGKLVYLDIKAGAEIISPILATLDSSPITAGQIVFLSFDAGLLREIKKQAPQYKAHWLCRVRKGRLFSGFRPSLESVLQTLRESGADGLASRHSDISDDFIKAVIAAGFEHHVWTVNDPRQAARFQKLGTQAIITSNPGSLRESFANNPP
ncbi:MAG: glycerophosphodiester phosphodiesterase [Luteolibacter sp.]